MLRIAQIFLCACAHHVAKSITVRECSAQQKLVADDLSTAFQLKVADQRHWSQSVAACVQRPA